tara:strand:- start:996 stop:1349 length:354 start_codon:yes stop_codon:yes gene_type:complete
MTKKELVRIIREVVKREVKSQLTEVTKSKGKVIKENNNQRISLEEALQQTAESDDYRTVKEFNASDARAGFASMQAGYTEKPQTDLHGKPVDLTQLGGGLDKALTRDYSQLVKRFNK